METKKNIFFASLSSCIGTVGSRCTLYSILWVCGSGSVYISPNPYNNVDIKVYENHKNIRIAKGFNVFV